MTVPLTAGGDGGGAIDRTRAWPVSEESVVNLIGVYENMCTATHMEFLHLTHTEFRSMYKENTTAMSRTKKNGQLYCKVAYKLTDDEEAISMGVPSLTKESLLHGITDSVVGCAEDKVDFMTFYYQDEYPDEPVKPGKWRLFNVHYSRLFKVQQIRSASSHSAASAIYPPPPSTRPTRQTHTSSKTAYAKAVSSPTASSPTASTPSPSLKHDQIVVGSESSTKIPKQYTNLPSLYAQVQAATDVDVLTQRLSRIHDPEHRSLILRALHCVSGIIESDTATNPLLQICKELFADVDGVTFERISKLQEADPLFRQAMTNPELSTFNALQPMYGAGDDGDDMHDSDHDSVGGGCAENDDDDEDDDERKLEDINGRIDIIKLNLQTKSTEEQEKTKEFESNNDQLSSYDEEFFSTCEAAHFDFVQISPDESTDDSYLQRCTDIFMSRDGVIVASLTYDEKSKLWEDIVSRIDKASRANDDARQRNKKLRVALAALRTDIKSLQQDLEKLTKEKDEVRTLIFILVFIRVSCYSYSRFI